ncbi:hypothetical protein Taro_026285 [Colocasia esculenta]|uniref:Glycosyltransferase n=1 Tax=Colocasia esculenta TaxID=4460 RepID=A0A843VQW2_COLES|nr:hypothetical protein [Colocasia esculenta]
MMKLAKLLHSKGFHITFVNTEYNSRLLLNSRGPTALDGLPDFCFQTIPDGLPPSDLVNCTQHTPSLCKSTMNSCLPHFRGLLTRLNGNREGVPPVSCVVYDAIMSFALDAAEELRVPAVLFWPAGACAFMGVYSYKEAIDRGLFPLRDEETQLRNGTSTPDDLFMVEVLIRVTHQASRASAVILNTFEDLERPVLDAMAPILSPSVYTVGPLSVLCGQLPPKSPGATMGSNLWKEDGSCLKWLEGRRPASVVYVNFGSVTVISNEQLVEFAWGLAGSGQDFLWVIRSDLVRGDSAVFPEEFLQETTARGLLASWCPQEAVLAHPAVGGFLTHNGWNSTLESISGGVPMLCWPFFADQQTNCRYACAEWGVGMEVDSNDVRREKLCALIRELITGTRGKEMREKALAWKERAENAAKPGGGSAMNLDNLVEEVLLSGLRQPGREGFGVRSKKGGKGELGWEVFPGGVLGFLRKREEEEREGALQFVAWLLLGGRRWSRDQWVQGSGIFFLGFPNQEEKKLFWGFSRLAFCTEDRESRSLRRKEAREGCVGPLPWKLEELQQAEILKREESVPLLVRNLGWPA